MKLFLLAPIIVCLFSAGSAAPSQPCPSPEYATTFTRGDAPAAGDTVTPVPDAEDTLFTIPFWKVEVKPQMISMPKPEYPEEARKAGIEGQAVVEALIDTNGSVASVRVLMTSGIAVLDQAATDAAKKAKFKPATQRGRPVSVWVSLPYRFILADERKTDPAGSRRVSVRDRSDVVTPSPPRPEQVPGLDSALADLARMLTDSAHGESLPRLAVTPFEELGGTVSDTGVYMAEALEALLAGSGRCRVIEHTAIARLLGVDALTRAAVMDTAARRSLVRTFRLSGVVVGTVARVDDRVKVMARVVSPRTGVIMRAGEVMVAAGPRRPSVPPPLPPPKPVLPAGVTRYEGEDMEVLRVSRGTTAKQPLSGYGFISEWSGAAHRWWIDARPGDRLELGFDVQTTDTYQVKIQLTKASDYAIAQLYLDDQKLGRPIDLYNGWVRGKDPERSRVTHTGPLNMGAHALDAGAHVLGVEILGANPKAAQTYVFGIDYLDLVKPGLRPRPSDSKTIRIEGEDLELKSVTGGTYEVQPYTFGSQWSGGRQSWWWGARPGDRLDLVLPVPPGRYRVTAQFCKAHDYGIVQLLIDGKKVGKPKDFYVEGVTVSGPVDLGIHNLGPGEHVLSAIIKGANPEMHLRGDDLSGGRILYLFAVDYLDMERLGPAAPDRAGPTPKAPPDSVVSIIKVGGDPHAVACVAGGRYVYAAKEAVDSVAVIDTDGGSVTARISVTGGPRHIAVMPDGSAVYVGDYGSGDVAVIRTSDNTVVARVKAGSGTNGLAVLPSGDYVYAANRLSNDVTVIKTADDTVVRTIAVGTDPRGVSCSPDGRYVYAANAGSGDISVIETENDSVTATFHVGGDPHRVVPLPSGDYLYVTRASSNEISVLRPSDGSAVASFTAGISPTGLAALPGSDYVYVADRDADCVSVIDTEDNMVIRTISTQQAPWDVAVAPDGRRVYVTLRHSAAVAVME